MRFSLICATVDRTEELYLLLNSLQTQSHQDFEVIIVDQNADDRLQPIIEQFSGQMEIKHSKSEKGLSKARNAGLDLATGEIIAFPDDDCWYQVVLLDKVNNWAIQNSNYAGISGMCFDDTQGRPYGRVSQYEGNVTKFNVWVKGSSASLFLKRDFVEKNIIRFDENLGLGSPNYSGEETDFILQMMEKGAHIYYSPDIKVGHPYKKQTINPQVIEQSHQYGIGFGRVMRKHHYPLWFYLFVAARSITGIMLALLKININEIHFHVAVLLGRSKGYFTAD